MTLRNEPNPLGYPSRPLSTQLLGPSGPITEPDLNRCWVQVARRTAPEHRARGVARVAIPAVALTTIIHALV